MAGLTDAGFETPSVEDILSSIEEDEKSTIKANLNVGADSIPGQLNTIFAARLQGAWEQLENLYQSVFPDMATGSTLGYLSAITGTIRKPATKARVTATVNLDAGTTLPANSAASVTGDSTMRFATTAAVTNSGGSPANVEVEMEAVEVGSHIFANSGTLTVIEDPVVGWNTVTNALDSVRGEDLETDAELRGRREEEIAFAGSCTLDAIRADMLSIVNVDACTVFENVTGFPDDQGVPPYSIEILLSGSGYDPQEVFDQILASKPAGVRTYGNSPGTAVDSGGSSHEVYYSVPTDVDVYIGITYSVTYDYVSDDAVKTSIVDWGTTLGTGKSVYAADLICIVQELDGVDLVDITQTFVGDTPSPVSVNLILGARSNPAFDTSRITITKT